MAENRYLLRGILSDAAEVTHQLPGQSPGSPASGHGNSEVVHSAWRDCLVCQLDPFADLLSLCYSTQVIYNEDPRDAVLEVVDSLRAEGFSPSVVLVPIDMVFRSRLALPLFANLTEDFPDWEMSTENQHYYSGKLSSIPVFRSTKIPQQAVVVVDLPSFGSLRWAKLEGAQLQIEVEVVTPETASLLAAQAESAGPRSEGQVAEDRVIELRTQVLVDVLERFDLAVDDHRACRVIAPT